jgi:Na+-transporting NADH:ubiquinone oxidoreductase subunit NqrB
VSAVLTPDGSVTPAAASPARVAPSMPAFDPRYYQIASLALLLLYGTVKLEFDISVLRIAIILAVALTTQLACTRYWALPRYEPWSALISGLSLCLLLRTNFHSVAILAAFVAVASKFVLRIDGKHVFNPTNIACVAAMMSGYGWLSPGQWGSQAFLAFLFACAGMMVVHRAERQDITYAALAFWTFGLFYRSWYVGEPWTIPMHRVQTGSFLLFAFFMISDPKTTPDSRLGRVLFAAMVCGAAWYWQFKLFHNNGLIWSLAAFSPLVPVIDRVLGGKRFEWAKAGGAS